LKRSSAITSSPKSPLDGEQTHVWVARQAILDRHRKVYGYELLFRSNAASNAFDGTESAAATMQVLSNTLMSIGAEALLKGKKAFVNFDERLLKANIHLTLPPKSFVIEILETVVPTEELAALCQGIQRQGYTLALDDFTGAASFGRLARLADIIKVDMRQTSRREQQEILDIYKSRGVVMLAEKVESYSEFEWARNAGYDLFQGYFFARPEVIVSRQIPAVNATCLLLLREIQKDNLDFRRLRELIRGDVSLTYKLLRHVNSALFAVRNKMNSVTRALAVLGEEHIRLWVLLATLPMLATNKPSELVKLSLVRARFCERLAQLGHSTRANEAFLMGMFSLLDALVDQPLNEALRSVDLGEEVTEALLGPGRDEDFLACLYRLICSYERGDWDDIERLSQKCGISPGVIGQAYIDSTTWAEQTLHQSGSAG